MVPKADYAVSMGSYRLSTHRIGFDGVGVLSAVEFDRQLAGREGEIRDITTDRMLSAHLDR
jgi:hypothetical protein